MKRRWKVLAVACAAALAMPATAAVAHDPEELGGGTPLTHPFGHKFWFWANYQTDANPANPFNTHVTSSDFAFWGNIAYVGDYGGFRIFDISRPVPREISNMRCYGPQGDPSVFDRDGNGMADTLVLSVDSPLNGTGCDARPATKDAQGQYPAGTWEGIRIFDVSNPYRPRQIHTVYQDCGSHTNTLLPAPSKGHGRHGGKADSIYVMNSSYPLGDGPTCGPLGEAAGRKVNHGVIQIVEIPFRDPTKAKELTELPIVYPGDADGVYKPVTDHGITAPLDNFLGCHDLSTFPGIGLVGAACGEQAQVWKIDRRTGLPDTANPMWHYDQPNVDFWHSATFSWDGKVANFIDESFGDGCPTVTTKTAGLPGPPKVYETGNMYFFETKSGELLSEFRNKRPTNDATSPTTGKYCSSHLGIPVPSFDRYLLVNAYYRGGSSVIDFSDPTDPKEIAFADMDGTNTWSAYTYIRRTTLTRTIPVYSNDGLSRNYGTSTAPVYPEAAYGFQRFTADVGRVGVIGFDHLNPQLQEKVIPNLLSLRKPNGKPSKHDRGHPGNGHRNQSARPWEK